MLPTPRKVLDRAVLLGAHNDCLRAGPTKSCEACFERVIEAFDYYYGSMAPEDVRLRIVADAASGS